MATMQKVFSQGSSTLDPLEAPAEMFEERWRAWPIYWGAAWAGTLATVAAVIVFGLIGVALGAHLTGPENRVVDLRKIGFGTLAFSVFSTFFASVIGGWIVGTIAGIRRSEPAMLHGAITWLLAIPLLVVLAALGAGSYMGGWYGGLAGSPSWAGPAAAPFERPDPVDITATAAQRAEYAAAQAQYREKMRQWREDTPRATRNAALGAVVALLIGLIGSAIGGWMASGEPMTFTYYRTRTTTAAPIS